jgi:hypothetical protein
MDRCQGRRAREARLSDVSSRNTKAVAPGTEQQQTNANQSRKTGLAPSVRCISKR